MERDSGKDINACDSKKRKLISVMGCHGVGKSTLANSLATDFCCKLPPETLPNSFSNNAILSFIHYIIERKKQHDQICCEYGRIITDRYGFLDTSIYISVIHSLGYCDDEEYALFQRVVNNLENVWVSPAALIVLTAEPEIIRQRLKNRPKSSSRHFRPFDLEFIANINRAFFEFSNTKTPPTFLSKKLKTLIECSRIIHIDNSDMDVSSTIMTAKEAIKHVF